jgi:hypothetical protein
MAIKGLSLQHGKDEMTYENSAKYLRLMAWARKRYTKGNRLVTYIGGEPSVYNRIERAAWARYA